MEPLDPSGWSFYCSHCEAQPDARLLNDRNVSTGEEYFELVCTACASILAIDGTEGLSRTAKGTAPELTVHRFIRIVRANRTPYLIVVNTAGNIKINVRSSGRATSA